MYDVVSILHLPRSSFAGLFLLVCVCSTFPCCFDVSCAFPQEVVRTGKELVRTWEKCFVGWQDDISPNALLMM